MHKVRNLYTVIARDFTTDAADKMNSILKIIDKFVFDINQNDLEKSQITLGAREIALPATYVVATSWLFDEKLKKDTLISFKINITDPDNKRLGHESEQENLCPRGIDKVNLNLKVQGLPVTAQGKYKLHANLFSKNGTLLAKGEYPFDVELNVD